MSPQVAAIRLFWWQCCTQKRPWPWQRGDNIIVLHNFHLSMHSALLTFANKQNKMCISTRREKILHNRTTTLALLFSDIRVLKTFRWNCCMKIDRFENIVIFFDTIKEITVSTVIFARSALEQVINLCSTL